MNESNSISKQTVLYGYIAEYAQQNRLSVNINREFKANNIDAMMIPMNIREDDVYFTISNMKKSHVNGAVIGFEYQESATEIMDSASELVQKSGLCDTVVVKDGTLVGEYFFSEVVKSLLESLEAKNIAIIGSDQNVKALALTCKEMQIALYDEHIEALMSLSNEIGLSVDINRIAEDMKLNLSAYDAVINLSDFDNLSMIAALPSVCIDYSESKNSSALHVRTTELNAKFYCYDDLLAIQQKITYNYITKG